MPPYADLYLDRIDLARYAGTATCQVCHVDSLEELVERLRSGQFCAGQCPHWPRERIEAFQMAIDAGTLLPRIPALSVPQPAAHGPVRLQRAGGGLARAGHRQLPPHARGAAGRAVDDDRAHVDALGRYRRPHGRHGAGLRDVHARGRRPRRPGRRLAGGGASRGRIILPGLAERLAGPVSEMLGRPVEAGPVCAAELPLFFGSDRVR